MVRYLLKTIIHDITPLILLHAARLMTRLMGVRPAVDFSWKALTYINVWIFDFLFVETMQLIEKGADSLLEYI